MSKFREDQLVRYIGPVDRDLGHDGDLGVGEVGPVLAGGLRVDFEFAGMRPSPNTRPAQNLTSRRATARQPRSWCW